MDVSKRVRGNVSVARRRRARPSGNLRLALSRGSSGRVRDHLPVLVPLESRAMRFGNRSVVLRKLFLVLEKSSVMLVKPSVVLDERELICTSRAMRLRNRFL